MSNLNVANIERTPGGARVDLVLMAEMVDREGRLQVPGAGYADVKVAPADLAAVKSLKVDHAGFKESTGVEPITGNDDALFHERLGMAARFG